MLRLKEDAGDEEYPGLEEEDIVQALKYAAWASSDRARPIPIKGAASA